jgi:NAD(P)-dependent dehydrogenase (short-subunit alcohol dehydrogenase family)
VVISLVGAESGISGQVTCGASEAGLVGMIRPLAADRASRGIRCNARMPGFIATPKVRAMSDQVQSAVTAQIRLGRFGEPMSWWGRSPSCSRRRRAYITGAVLRVDVASELAVR